MFKKILTALMCATVLVVSGCGGGGGGGGGGSSADSVSISVSQQSVAVAATTYVAAPTASLTVTADSVPSGGLYVQGSYTTHGINTVNTVVSGNTDYLTLSFKLPSALGVGVYTDTLSIQVCLDSACTRQVNNSPRQITVTYTVTAGTSGTPPPALSLLSPSTVGRGGSDFILTLTGTNFDAASTVTWNGTGRQTTYVSPTQLLVDIAASDIVTAGSYPVVVMKPATPGVPSNTLSVTVANAALSLTKVSPTSVTAGNTAFTQTVFGTGFDVTSVVQWNGSSRTTTFVSTTELLAQISATDVASVATANVTVTKSGSSPTSAKTVSIVAPSIEATAFQINAQHNGAINFANIVAPSAFPLASKWTAALNGPPSYALVAGGNVFATAPVSGGGSELYAFSVATGATVWGPVALPNKVNAAYDNGRLFVLSAATTGPGTLYAYDASSGALLWTTALALPTVFAGPPTAANGMVYVGGGGTSASLYAIDQTTGTMAWHKLTQVAGNSTPAVTTDGVFVSAACQTNGFRPLSGELVWNHLGLCSSGGGATDVAADGFIYAPGNASGYSGSSLYASSGGTNWSYTASAPPAVGSQWGYFLQSGTLHALLLSNRNVDWSFSGDGGLATAPILVNNYVFAFSSTGNLYALDATTGNQLWQTNLGGTMGGFAAFPFSGLSAGGGLLVVPVGNTLVAYTLSNNP